jgi:hypothetical protein
MRALLVLNNAEFGGCIKVIVNLHTTPLRKRVITLLSLDKKREALDLLVSKAMVETYVPEGRRPSIEPELTLVQGT